MQTNVCGTAVFDLYERQIGSQSGVEVSERYLTVSVKAPNRRTQLAACYLAPGLRIQVHRIRTPPMRLRIPAYLLFRRVRTEEFGQRLEVRVLKKFSGI